MAQNLVSASLTPVQQTEINTLITTLKSKLSFLKSMQPNEILGLVKANNAYYPLIDIAKETVTKHPEILAGVFDKTEFIKDYELLMALKPILLQVNELQETLEKTTIAVSSDLMSATLDVYSSVKTNKDKVPGLNSTYEKMKVFFKRQRKDSTETPN